MELLTEINRLIDAQEVFVLARIVAAPDNSHIGRRYLITKETPAAETTDEFALIKTKAIELLASDATGVKTLWHHDAAGWSERKHGAALGVMFDLIRPQPELLICGAGHVGHAVARLGAFLEYKVTVLDEREEFANREKLPDPRIALVARPFAAALADSPITSSTNIVIVTRGHAQDEVCLRAVLRSPAGYIGMIGSKRRVNGIFERLLEVGFTRAETERVHAPIGLKIGARTPEEIAVAILAEIIAVRTGNAV